MVTLIEFHVLSRNLNVLMFELPRKRYTKNIFKKGNACLLILIFNQVILNLQSSCQNLKLVLYYSQRGYNWSLKIQMLTWLLSLRSRDLILPAADLSREQAS